MVFRTNNLQVTKLCGPEPLSKYVVLFVVFLQVFCAYLLRSCPFLSWPTFLTAYIIGATANQNLFLAIHEISHNLAFRSPFANRVFAVFANLPIGIPYSASFRVRSLYAPDTKPHQLKSGIQLTLLLLAALPPNAPQIPRRQRPRHGPPHRLRSPFSRLRRRQGLLLHLSDPLLCPASHARLSAALY